MIFGRQPLVRYNTPRPDGTPRIRSDRPTRVTGARPDPGVPCLAVILMDSTGDRDEGLDRFQTAAKERGDSCIIIRAGDCQQAVINAVHQYIPSNATVVLLSIDASPAQVEAIRGALHNTQDIITWSQDSASAPGGSHAWIDLTGDQAPHPPSLFEEAVNSTLIELGRRRLQPRLTVWGNKPLDLNNKSQQRRLLGCYQISCQVVMDALVGSLDGHKYASLGALEDNVKLTTHREVLRFASRAQQSSIENNESFGMLQQRQAKRLGPDAPVCAFLVRSSAHAMAMVLRHSRDLEGWCRVSFIDPYRTNCVVELEATTADLASASLRTYLEILDRDTTVGHRFEALFKGEDCFVVDVFWPSDLDKNPPLGPRPLQSMQKAPISAVQLMLLAENN